MTYTIENNAQFGSKEIYFDGKPSEDVRSALKALKFRWHSVKKCWYGYAAASEVVNAILSASSEESPAEVVTDGYLGGGAVYGSKSNLGLHGSDLAKAIRADIKKAGIKGVTIASKHGNIQATITMQKADIVPYDEFLDGYQVKGSFGWVDYRDDDGVRRSIDIYHYYDLDEELKERIRQETAEIEYRRDYTTVNGLNHYHIDKYEGFTAQGREKIKAVLAIVSAYRYDESNTMVDYFNTNFYIDIYTKPGRDIAGAA